MASQPANTQITVRRTCRTRMELGLFESIKVRTQRLGNQVVIAPGEEIDVYMNLDANGTNAPGPNPAWRYGMPITVNQRTRSTVAQMYAAIAADPNAASLDFPKQIVGTTEDRFLQNLAANAANDLHADIRNNEPPPRGLWQQV